MSFVIVFRLIFVFNEVLLIGSFSISFGVPKHQNISLFFSAFECNYVVEIYLEVYQEILLFNSTKGPARGAEGYEFFS